MHKDFFHRCQAAIGVEFYTETPLDKIGCNIFAMEAEAEIIVKN